MKRNSAKDKYFQDIQFINSRLDELENLNRSKFNFPSFYKIREFIRTIVEILAAPALASIIYHFTK